MNEKEITRNSLSKCISPMAVAIASAPKNNVKNPMKPIPNKNQKDTQIISSASCFFPRSNRSATIFEIIMGNP